MNERELQKEISEIDKRLNDLEQEELSYDNSKNREWEKQYKEFEQTGETISLIAEKDKKIAEWINVLSDNNEFNWQQKSRALSSSLFNILDRIIKQSKNPHLSLIKQYNIVNTSDNLINNNDKKELINLVMELNRLSTASIGEIYANDSATNNVIDSVDNNLNDKNKKVDLNSAYFENLVKERVNDDKISQLIINYFLKKLKETPNVAIINFNDISKYEDIFSEFKHYLLTGNYNIENPLYIENYSAQKILELSPTLTASGVYSCMTWLRDNPIEAKEWFNKGLPNKDLFVYEPNKLKDKFEQQRKKIDKMFETDENDRFVRLIIPKGITNVDGIPNEEINLINKKRAELNLDEVVILKKYASQLYQSSGVSKIEFPHRDEYINETYIDVDGKTKERSRKISIVTIENDFYLMINKGTTLPIEHENYNDGRTIIKIIGINDSVISFDNKKYQYSINLKHKIKAYIDKNLEQLIKYSIMEDSNFLINNVISGNEKTNIEIKLGKLTISLNGQVRGEISDYCDQFINSIKEIIMSGKLTTDDIDNIIKSAIEKVKSISNGSEFTINQIVDNFDAIDDFNDKFDVFNKVIEEIEKQRMHLEPTNTGIIGMPWASSFIKK